MLTILLFLGLFGEPALPPKPTGPVEHKVIYNGDFIQGGLVRLTAPQGSEIKLDGERVKAAGNYYYIGFGRDAAPSSFLQVEYPDGVERTYLLNIKQREYKVQYINNVDDVINNPSAKDLSIIHKEVFQLAAARHFGEYPCTGSLNFTRPAPGRISGVYGSQRVYNGNPGNPHSGIDFAGAVGDAARAPESGQIVFLDDMVLTGKTIAIDHGCGVVSTLMHLSAAEKNIGDIVQKGEVVARIGRTGIATGPHLHWSLNLGSIRLDPLLVLK